MSVVYFSTLKNQGKTIFTEEDICGESISSIEPAFSSENIKQAVNNLVMSKFEAKLKPKRCKKLSVGDSLSDDNSTSSFSFDQKEFLKIALGNEFGILPQDEDFSVHTSNLSELISSGLYDSSYSFPTSSINQHIDETCQVRDKYSPTSFCEELSLTNQIRVQILKAIYFYDKCEKRKLNLERVEAEKLLLANDLKAQILLEQLQRNRLKEIDTGASKGSVDISQIHFCPKDPEFDNYVMCVVSHQSQLYISEISKIKSNGLICFKKNIFLSSLPHDFKIRIRLYIMSPHQVFRKSNRRLICVDPNNDLNDIPVRSSLFTLWDEAILTLQDVKQLQFQRPSSIQFGTSGELMMQITSKAEVNPYTTGFMDVGKRTKCAVWNTYWCTLEDRILQCFAYPQDDTPEIVIDLSICDLVRRMTREECARKRTIFIQCKRSQFIFSLSSEREILKWERCLKVVTSAMKTWEVVC